LGGTHADRILADQGRRRRVRRDVPVRDRLSNTARGALGAPGLRRRNGTRGQRPSIAVVVHRGAQAIPRARAYDRLLTLSAGAEPLNELQESFLKAVRWYREARWEEDPARRFAFYWIGLEHIFAGGQQEKGKNIYADLPDLQITWRNLGRALLPLSWSNREVGDKIEGDDELDALVDSHPELKDWRSDERVLLDPEKVKLLTDLTLQEKVDAKKLFQGYRDQLLEIASHSGDISDDVGRLRDRQWFKLYLLYTLRNAMFHEAVYEDERLPYLADEIGDVADGVLPKVVDEATSPTPECTTIKQLIERVGQQPWGA
jgi:hypothetical protein